MPYRDRVAFETLRRLAESTSETLVRYGRLMAAGDREALERSLEDARGLLERPLEKPRGRPMGRPGHVVLPAQIFELFAQGLSFGQIACELGVHRQSVRKYVKRREAAQRALAAEIEAARRDDPPFLRKSAG